MLKLAWRNIWRAPRRTVLTLFGIVFACTVVVFGIGLQLSSYEVSITASVQLLTGHLQIQAPGYFARPEMRNTIPNPNELAEIVRDDPGVLAASPRAFGFALVSSDTRSYGAQVIGVVPEQEPSLSRLPSLVRNGQYLASPTALEAVVGSGLAKNLRRDVGDEITLLGSGRDGSVAATTLRIVGTFESGMNELDRAALEIPLETFQDVFGMEGSAHTITIAARSLDQATAIQERLRTLPGFPSLAVLRWDELLPGLMEAIKLDLATGSIFNLTLIVIVCMTILNTFLMSVLERTREFGVMMALGMRPFALARLVLTECFVLTVFGVALGIACGAGVLGYFSVYGFHIPGSEAIMAHWNLPTSIHTKLSFTALLLGPSVVLLTGILSALYPAGRLARLKPLDALRAP